MKVSINDWLLYNTLKTGFSATAKPMEGEEEALYGSLLGR